MKITTSMQGDTNVLAIKGEFLGDLVPRFQEAVQEAVEQGHRDFVVDLSEARLLDSAALEAITALQRHTDEQLGMLRVCVSDATLRKLFEITRLDRLLAIDTTLEESLAGFGAALVSGSHGGGGK